MHWKTTPAIASSRKKFDSVRTYVSAACDDLRPAAQRRDEHDGVPAGAVRTAPGPGP
jgi:hypothetical protein